MVVAFSPVINSIAPRSGSLVMGRFGVSVRNSSWLDLFSRRLAQGSGKVVQAKRRTHQVIGLANKLGRVGQNGGASLANVSYSHGSVRLGRIAGIVKRSLLLDGLRAPQKVVDKDRKSDDGDRYAELLSMLL